MRERGTAFCAVALVAALLTGCGGGGDEGRSVALPSGVKGHVYLAIALDRADGSLFVSTDKGLLRLARGAKRAELVRGTFRDGLIRVPLRRDSPVTVVGPHRLLGSGHPGASGPVPQNLGLIVSTDDGATWDSVSLTGQSDLHVLRVAVGGAWLYANDTARGRVVLTRDNGRTWKSHPAPGLVADLAADPEDLDHVLASTDNGPLASTDAGANWRPFAQRDADRFLWPASAALYLFDRSGNVRLSDDGGESAKLVGSVGAPVEALVAASRNDLYALSRDGKIRRSRDGGKTWRVEIRLVGG